MKKLFFSLVAMIMPAIVFAQKGYTCIETEGVSYRIVPSSDTYPCDPIWGWFGDDCLIKTSSNNITLYTDKDSLGTLVWSNKYTCDPAPGFWYGTKTYLNTEGQMVVDNTGYDELTGENSFGFSLMDEGIRFFQYPGKRTIGDKYTANVYVVDEETKNYLKCVLHIKYVKRQYDSLDVKKLTLVGDTVINIKDNIHQEYKHRDFAINMESVKKALGCKNEELEDIYAWENDSVMSNRHTERSGAFYFNEDGYIGEFTNDATFYLYLPEGVESTEGRYGLGQKINSYTNIPQNVLLKTQYAFIYQNKYYKVNINYTIKASPIYPDANGIVTVIEPNGELDTIVQNKEFVRNLIIEESMLKNDLAALKQFPNIEELTLPLVNSQKDSIQLGRLDKLLTVTTTDSASVLQDYVFEGATPNLMIYAPTGATVESPGRNIILGGVSESILLTDGYPVLIPVTFTAKTISYTRSFSKQTVVGQSSGWETLALPYQVQTIATQDGRTLVPFGAEQTGDGNFWLAAMGSDGFQAATAIAVNTPYILAMPNNEEYTLGNVTGPVTFSATDAEVRSTTGLSPVEGAYIFTPTYRGQGGSGIYAINDEAYQDYLPGGVFVRGLRDVRPFEAYLTLPAGAKQRNVIPVFESETTGMDDVRWSMYDERWTMYDERWTMDDVPGGEAYYDLSGRRIGKPTKTGTYLLKNGKRVQKVWVK